MPTRPMVRGKCGRLRLLSFSEMAGDFADIATPINGQVPTRDISMKTAETPIGYTIYVPVLNGIEMNVIDVSYEIIFITNGMFPESTLPNALFSFGTFTRRTIRCSRQAP